MLRNNEIVYTLKQKFSSLKFLKLLSKILLKSYEENLEKIISDLENVDYHMIDNLELEQVDKKNKVIFQILKEHKYKTDALFRALILNDKPKAIEVYLKV